MKTRLLLCGVLISCVAFAGVAEDVKPETSLEKKFVGNQLRALTLEPDGAMIAKKDAWINLYYTEGVPFRLSGKVWLGGPSKTLEFPQDLPDGFALFLREWDSLHRYSLTSRSMTVKRRLHDGIREPKIARVTELEATPAGEWVPFTVEATPAQIVFKFGERSGVIHGPLEMDGANKIALAPGTKIKDIQLEILEADEKPRSPAAAVAPASSAAQYAAAENSSGLETAVALSKTETGKVALSFHTVPGKTYRLMFKNDLGDLSWTPLGGPVTANGAAMVIHDDASAPKRFYTVVQEP